MCGIVGVAGPKATDLARDWMDGALLALRHRGPDAQAITHLQGAVLGHARLSIIDLSPAGAQPMTSASGRTVIAYNGEVYNTAELRRKLGPIQLRGRSDTELVLERMERDGLAALRTRWAEPIGAWHPAASASDPDDLPALLQTCVADQLVADVPVGVLLSGGVDSSLVAAAAARTVGKVRTFSVVHADPRYDERKAARAVAEHIGRDHVELELPAAGLTESELDELVDHHGDPFADSSSLPTRRLARLVRRHVTVALSGDGGDELFAGYPRYRENGWVSTAAHLGHQATAAMGKAATTVNRRAGANHTVRGKLRRVARLFDLASRPTAERAVGTLTYFWPNEARRLLRPAFHGPADGLAALIRDRAAAGLDPALAEGCHRLEQRLVLPDDMLVKVDRMTMAESLEIRPPLLDKRMVAFAQGLPLRHKLHRGEGKVALKALARQWVPPWVVDRPNQGFAVPLLAFGGAVLQDRTRWALQGHDSPLRTLFEPSALLRLQTEFAQQGEGWQPEDSPYRRAHRQWTLVLLATAMQRRGWQP